MEAGTGRVDDLAALSHLDEETLQSELEIRYRAGQIYVSSQNAALLVKLVFCQHFFICFTCDHISIVIAT